MRHQPPPVVPRPDERLLGGVLRLTQISRQRVQMRDQLTVRGLVEHPKVVAAPAGSSAGPLALLHDHDATVCRAPNHPATGLAAPPAPHSGIFRS
ncbi:hypothetical protein KCH_28270 [Kitasatospora cheerisanensis KCTC 2395]|uniref:Uncharacterized protein n=1 Tax=Kitasatospora cheerisanensis KCTC 2395 TaxID=1348663 RepID=A0A066Z510_9ACTN|nr:hypothetical protein KCH_28270 [Kitasatospora cheerisanensis KCTC 2395]